MRTLLIALAMLSSVVLSAQARVVVDMAGRSVEIPDRVDRVACLEILCYPRMFMLGADDRIALTARTAAPWMAATNPRLASIPSYLGDFSIEELAARRVDVAFIRYNPDQVLPLFKAAGIPALIAQPYPSDPKTPEDFVRDLKRMVTLVGEVTGTQERARAWTDYVDERLRFVAERVARVPEGKRPRAYYMRGPGALNTQGKNGYTYWAGTLAGADMVVGRANVMSKGDISMENMIAWDPEWIFVGRQYPLEAVLNDPRWRDISAVRNRHVVSTPEGVFYWDGGPEQILSIQFTASTLHPDLFADFDMSTEIRRYYERWYGAKLSADDAAKLLSGRGPDGSRFNPMNN